MSALFEARRRGRESGKVQRMERANMPHFGCHHSDQRDGAAVTRLSGVKGKVAWPHGAGAWTKQASRCGGREGDRGRALVGRFFVRS